MTDNFGSGVVRLMVDDYSYYIYTSNPAEIFEIEEMVKSGMSYDEAIKEMVRKYRQK
jgi:conjugal transfer ATP-binding protein TraC